MNGVNGLKQPVVTTSVESVTNDETQLNASSPKNTIKTEDALTEISNGVESLKIPVKNNLDLDKKDKTLKSNGLKKECQTEAVLSTETNVPQEIKSNNLQTYSNNSSLDSVSKKEDSHKPELCSKNVRENTHMGLLELEHITTNSFESNVKSEDNSVDPLKDNAVDPLNITDNGTSDNLNRLAHEVRTDDIKRVLCESSDSDVDSQDESERQDSQDDEDIERLDPQKDDKPEGQKSHDTISTDSTSDIEEDDLPYSSSEVTSDEVIVLDQSVPTTNASISSLRSDLQKIKNVSEREASIQESTLRRSTRAVKRTQYDLGSDNDEYDYDDIILEQPKHNSRPIYIKDTKSLVEMSKQMKPKKEPTIVIIDQTTKNQKNSNLIQNMAFRGTTVTPIERPILPSLTDDMFVVEAPSFIVPYVYEKPSIEPFREFVDKLGDTIREQEKNEQKEKSDKEIAEKAKKAEERRLRKENGEKVSESEDDNVKVPLTEEEKKRKKEEKKERRNRKTEDDDATWDGESSSDSEDNTDEEDKSLEIITDTPVTNTPATAADNYFGLSLGKFFMDIGLNLVQEFVQTDLLKTEKRKLNREKRANRPTKDAEQSIAQLNNNLELTKQKNAPFKSELKKCEQCNFKSESLLVISNHTETPHMKNNMYYCSYCTFVCKSPLDIFTHTESVHGVLGKVERPLSHHQCPNCQYEDNSKGKLARHMVGCAKRFKPEFLLAPPTEWEPPAKIPKMNKSRNQILGTLHNPFQRGQMSNNINRPIGNSMILGSTTFRPRARAPMGVPVRLGIPGIPIRPPLTIRPISNVPINNNVPLNAPVKHQPSLSITPLPRQPKPARSNKITCVVCEICDGYIVDLEQLRSHMQSVHNVKIHPKMIYNRPPLNCQKCNFRSFTDQGLERHLLGFHGLVTRSMQESANQGKDSGRCPVCGKVYQMKLLAHVGRDHKKILKPAHLSYKCTVCTATFGMYKQFENHVYSAHSVIAKRVIDKKQTNSQTDPMAVKIKDVTTITPQPGKTSQDPN